MSTVHGGRVHTSVEVNHDLEPDGLSPVKGPPKDIVRSLHVRVTIQWCD